ncbi:alpha/beta hydrolase [Serratia marcescens]|uniref:alpha/beta hydrolase family protein n=1 Tax=Serratia TaxID=613 RepID=UPI000668FABD|nr:MULTISPECIES: alpha/beta hydrolase [Serratia]ASM31815.1 alpha/beta hydrolase [Serratia marcescens]AVU31185.1 alpha/beta hydrolase [Serratia marcescens]EMB2735199.1 alpha/beta hydrolase [Serratia marcescens]MBH2625476.1 alpha/beta hydrolase [Serratia marcescens]MBH2715459.1 alpha/beta hydrolase [Serratia marcescens]
MTQTTSTPSREEADTIVESMVAIFSKPIRSPVIGKPTDFGLQYEDVFFPALDGVPLEAWFIPCVGSDKVIICNHPVWCSRTGLPADREPWRSIGAAGGNDFAFSFLPDYKILHDAGYNVLAYDLRNLGLSGEANGGIGSIGVLEARDVVGSLNYVRSRPDLKGKKIGLFSRCMGGNATFFAMAKYPEQFNDVRCVVMPQPISMRAAVGVATELAGIPDRLDEIDERLAMVTSFHLDEMDPSVPARTNTSVPTFIYQVHDDVMTRPSDVQNIFDSMPVKEKQLHWIRNTTHRWDGYLYFQREPKLMLDWFNNYMN